MPATAKTTLKTYFKTGDRPSQAQFADLIDTLASLLEDVANNVTTTATGLVLDARQGKVLKDLIDLKATVVAAPATSTSVGTAGTIAFDASYVYYCSATNVWVRSPLATW